MPPVRENSIPETTTFHRMFTLSLLMLRSAQKVHAITYFELVLLVVKIFFILTNTTININMICFCATLWPASEKSAGKISLARCFIFTFYIYSVFSTMNNNDGIKAAHIVLKWLELFEEHACSIEEKREWAIYSVGSYASCHTIRVCVASEFYVSKFRCNIKCMEMAKHWPHHIYARSNAFYCLLKRHR